MSSNTSGTVLPLAAPFSQAQQAILHAMMDLLIPASVDGRMPAAASLGLFAGPDTLAAKERRILKDGLTALDAQALTQYGMPFAKLPARDAMVLVQVLRDEGSLFVHTFTLHTVGRYLQHDRIMPLIGLEARPPWPKGNPVEPGDWSLLEPVRQRPKFYRDV